MWEAMLGIIESNQMPFRVGSILLAIVICLCGYLLLKVWSALISLGLGFAIGMIIVPRLVPDASKMTLILVSLGCSGLICLLAFIFKKFALFLIGTVLGLILLRMIPFPQADNLHLIIVAVIAVGSFLAGVVTMMKGKKAVILLSVLAGGSTLVSQLGEKIIPAGADSKWKLAVMAVVVAISMLVQILTTKD